MTSSTFALRVNAPNGAKTNKQRRPIGSASVGQRRNEPKCGPATTKQREASTNTGLKRRQAMKSPVIKRSIVIAGHKTSVSLEDAFWKGLKDIAISRSLTLSDLVATID